MPDQEHVPVLVRNLLEVVRELLPPRVDIAAAEAGEAPVEAPVVKDRDIRRVPARGVEEPRGQAAPGPIAAAPEPVDEDYDPVRGPASAAVKVESRPTEPLGREGRLCQPLYQRRETPCIPQP